RPRRLSSRLTDGLGKWSGQHLHLIVLTDAYGVADQRTRWRPPGDAAIRVVDAPVARAQEQLGVGTPVDGTAQMRAVESEHNEVLVGVAPQPDRGAGGLTGPRERCRIVNGDLDGLADLKVLHRPQVAPVLGRGIQQWTQQVCND